MWHLLPHYILLPVLPRQITLNSLTYPTICRRSSFLLSMSSLVCCWIRLISSTVCEQNKSSVSFSTPPTTPMGLPGDPRDLNMDRPGERGELLLRGPGPAESTLTLRLGGELELVKLWPKDSQLRGDCTQEVTGTKRTQWSLWWERLDGGLYLRTTPQSTHHTVLYCTVLTFAIVFDWRWIWSAVYRSSMALDATRSAIARRCLWVAESSHLLAINTPCFCSQRTYTTCMSGCMQTVVDSAHYSTWTFCCKFRLFNSQCTNVIILVPSTLVQKNKPARKTKNTRTKLNGDENIRCKQTIYRTSDTCYHIIHIQNNHNISNKILRHKNTHIIQWPTSRLSRGT